MTGINIQQLKYLVVEPVLSGLGLTSACAVSLVTGTALAESGAAFIKQENDGPALGLWQIEPATEQDIWNNYLVFRPVLEARVKSLLASGATTQQLIWNLAYGTAICRIKYLRSPLPLPDKQDAAAMAALHKQVYNTARGAADQTVNSPLFQQAINA